MPCRRVISGTAAVFNATTGSNSILDRIPQPGKPRQIWPFNERLKAQKSAAAVRLQRRGRKPAKESAGPAGADYLAKSVRDQGCCSGSYLARFISGALYQRQHQGHVGFGQW